MQFEEYVKNDLKPLFDKIDGREKMFLIALITAFYIKQCERVINVLYGKEVKE